MTEIDVYSFGYKYGDFCGANYLYDVRCFRNPYYEPALKDKNGLDSEVFNYVFSDEKADKFFFSVKEALDLALPVFIERNIPRVIISFGCTGGQHRSVAFAKRFYDYLRFRYDNVVLINREFSGEKI